MNPIQSKTLKRCEITLQTLYNLANRYGNKQVFFGTMLFMNIAIDSGKKVFNKLGSFIRKNPKTIIIISAVIVLFFVFSGGSKSVYQSYVVSKQDVIDAVELTGKVSAVDRADLSFGATGTIQSVSVQEGQAVQRGDIIARLELGTLSGELARAQAAVSLAQAGVDSAQASLDIIRAGNAGTFSTIASAAANLEKVTAEQNQAVTNAKRALLTNDIQAYAVDPSRSTLQPVVSGSYNGETEGEYILDFYRSGTQSSYSARYSGLESGVISFVDFDVPVPLGTKGLYVALPTGGNSYTNTDYRVSIPNARSSTYQTLLNSYNASKETADRLISAARNELARLQSGESAGNSATSAEVARAQANLQSARATLTQARAGVAVVQAQVDDKVLRAPFSGTVARTNLQVGESVSLGEVVATVISNGDFEIELQVPEIDVARLEPNMPAVITLDAYNDSAVWNGMITAIEQVDTIVEGVPVYVTTVTITDPDDRIKIGMNARASIELNRVENVVTIPKSYLNEVDNRTYVLTGTADNLTETPVRIGLVGADSLVQIVSGLEVGQTVLREQIESQ